MEAADWLDWVQAHEVPAFTVDQIRGWVFRRGVTDPARFTNVAKKVRGWLEEELDWSLPQVDTALRSRDGSEKILFRTWDGLLAECVLMPYAGRVTLCLSSQVGCRWGCTFCQTGRMGLSRSLTAGEIVGQVLLANERLRMAGAEAEPRAEEKPAKGEAVGMAEAGRTDDPDPWEEAWAKEAEAAVEAAPGAGEGDAEAGEKGAVRKVSNIVFMGMGEPLDNFAEVVRACRIFTDPRGFNLSKNRVTVSTVGLVPEIARLGREVAVSLAISLHTADEEERSAMMPVNRRYPLAELKKALLEYPILTRNGITFEYVMIRGKNDSVAHARKLVHFLHGLKAKVNLIPMNAHPGNPMEASDEEHLRAFQKYLADRSIPAPVRYSRGQDVSAACGQLAMKRLEDLHRPPAEVIRERRRERRTQEDAREESGNGA